MTDVLVVGGGVSGVTTAHRLAKRGCSVMLLEAGERVGEGACLANGGMLTPSQTDPWNRPGILPFLLRSLADSRSTFKIRGHAILPLASWGWQFLRNATPERHALATRRMLELAHYSLQVFRPYLETQAAGFDAVRCGTMKTFRSQSAFDAHCAANAELEPLGLRYEVLDRAAAVDREPQLAPIAGQLVGTIGYPADIVADANKFCRMLAQDLREMGHDIRTGCRAKALIAEGDTIIGVETDSGALRAAHTVLTLGADPDRLAAGAGIHLPIRPVKGYSIIYDTTEINAVPATPVIDDTLHIGVIPIGKRLRVAGSADFAGYDQRIPVDRIALLESIFGQVYPELAGSLIARGGTSWAGLRPMSSDGLPFIGQTRRPGLWVNAGHGHLGWTLAAGSAEILADLLLGKKPVIDPSYFGLER